MKPEKLKTRIFLDGGDANETRAILKLLGFLDGQTTNPTLVAKNPAVRKRLEQGELFSAAELLDFYREIVEEVASLIPRGSVSVEVYADSASQAETMYRQGKEMYSWIANAQIKFPTSREGVRAAAQAVRSGMRVNMTLCFSQEQAAAVHAATIGAGTGQVFVSPFVGRLDDRGERGMDLVANILKMYGNGDEHVDVLTASVRSLDHLMSALQLESDIITAPFDVLRAWGEQGMPVPDPDYVAPHSSLKPVPYRVIRLDRRWEDYDIRHDLTDAGMKQFSADWNALISAPRRKAYGSRG
ncbi:MAG TPA: transaldolase family protein [Nitrospirota bacterium]|nr:transaldolase family protein [Nitrospirota bacterium]